MLGIHDDSSRWCHRRNSRRWHNFLSSIESPPAIEGAAFRFRRSIRIAKGVRINLSKSGIGLSAGGRGFCVGVGPRGAYTSMGIPGTGLYSINYLGKDTGRSRTVGVSGGAPGAGQISRCRRSWPAIPPLLPWVVCDSSVP
ncbi:MAG: DUF4236 domain-containing protein [Patescibacteria group bacterium]